MKILGYIRDSVSGIFRKGATVDSTIRGVGSYYDPTTASYYNPRNQKIEEWLDSIGVYNYDICNGVVHVVGDVIIDTPQNMKAGRLQYKQLGRLPFQFGYVSGDFHCGHIQLDALYGCPSEVGGSFICGGNTLTSLVGCPSEVGGDFYCNDNKLTSLDGPKVVGGDFYCSNNFFCGDPTGALDIEIGGQVFWR
jgi:hypothetical protein